MTNTLIQKVGGTSFGLLLVDDWLVGMFRTMNDVWHFLEYVGIQLSEGEPVPSEIYIFLITTADNPDHVEILETGKLVKTAITVEGVEKEFFVYTALHDEPNTKEVHNKVLELLPTIIRTLYE